MMKFLRSQSQTVLTLILAVLVVGFILYGNSGNLLTNGPRGGDDFGRIDGVNLSLADLSAAVRGIHNANLLQGREDAQVGEMAWVQLLLLHEADRLHIQISDDEMKTFIQGIPAFQKNGVWDPQQYQDRLSELQARFRISPDTFLALQRDNLRATAVSQALFNSIHTSVKNIPGEYDKYYGPTTVTVATIDAKTSVAPATVTEQEIETEYKAHPENAAYRTNEQRKVDYVLFLLPPDQAKLDEAKKKAAKETLGEKALDFVLAFQPDPAASSNTTPPPAPDFVAEAKKRGLNPATTPFFAADAPPGQLPPSPAFNNAAFSLTKENPVSKVIELENGVAVLHLVDIQASQLRPLAEVKDVVTKQVQEGKARQIAQTTVQLDSQLLRSLVAKGTDFKTAAANLKLKVETLPAFVPYTAVTAGGKNADPRLQMAAYSVVEMKPGDVSGPIPMENGSGTLIIHLDSRSKAEAAGLVDFEKRFRKSKDDEVRNFIFRDWADWAGKRPGTRKPPNLDAYSSSSVE